LLSGAILAAALLVELSTAGPAGTATFVVKNTNDEGPDSLRAAIVAGMRLCSGSARHTGSGSGG